eukprot:TRINITY_DN675_c0_g1_i1.p2 TRINITY_DN675_c0_g1~~TRINITY_DN675_c0_g1_i1.p2  ORF type:complete len:206 (-),score=80.22 TRINITY_DN675_c0_g1_i1:326-943(-)
MADVETKKDEVKIEDEPPALEPTDEPPALEDAPAAPIGSVAADNEEGKPGKQSRSEKKARKELAKLKLKPVPGIVRVTVKKAKSILFVITKPDVFKLPASETYIIFGEAKIEDLASQNLSSKAKTLLESEVPVSAGEKKPEAEAPKAAATAEPAAEEEAVDESGLEPKDIELVVSQTNVSRARAVKALRANNGDIVNSIMELTMS